MFRIKICGLTDPQDAQLARRAGADAVGLNFYPSSPRFVELSRAQEIAAQIPEDVLKVGVFVNASAAEITQFAQQVPLDAIQLHGDEPASFLKELRALCSLPLIKAFRCGRAGLAPLIEFLGVCQKLECLPTALLIDAAAPGQYGGSGEQVDWASLPRVREQLLGLPVILAGGLKPENVAKAIAIAQPAGVDVASGVEEAPGRKDEALVRSFIASANKAFEIT